MKLLRTELNKEIERKNKYIEVEFFGNKFEYLKGRIAGGEFECIKLD